MGGPESFGFPDEINNSEDIKKEGTVEEETVPSLEKSDEQTRIEILEAHKLDPSMYSGATSMEDLVGILTENSYETPGKPAGARFLNLVENQGQYYFDKTPGLDGVLNMINKAYDGDYEANEALKQQYPHLHETVTALRYK